MFGDDGLPHLHRVLPEVRTRFNSARSLTTTASDIVLRISILPSARCTSAVIPSAPLTGAYTAILRHC